MNGVADPYLPGHGDVRFQVEHYDLDLQYKVADNHLEGRAHLRLTATQALPEIVLDLHGLQVTSLRLTGAPVARWTHRSSRLRVRLRTPVAAGAELGVTVAYRGRPRAMPGPDGPSGWEELTDGVIVAAQPHGAPTWFPCNDRMSDKATYTRHRAHRPRLPGRLQRHPHLAAPGRATGRVGARAAGAHVDLPRDPADRALRARAAAGHRTWRRARSPPHGPGCRPPAPRSPTSPACSRSSPALFGPYPFDGYTVVVTDDALEIPLESQTLSTFGTNHLSRSWEAQRLIAHELAHQWFGNTVTAASLRDIWLHEGFACYAEWLWSESIGRTTAQEEAERHHVVLARLPQDLVLADPGRHRVFDDRVYKRGALTLHTLRRAVGDDLFFALLRAWVDRHRFGVVTTADFLALVRDEAGSTPTGCSGRGCASRPCHPWSAPRRPHVR